MSDNGKRPGRGGPAPQVPRPMRTMSFWFLMVILLFIAIQLINYNKPQEYEVNYTRFLTELEQGNLRELEFMGEKARGRFRESVSINVRNEAIEVERFWVKTGEPSYSLMEKIHSFNTEQNPITVSIGDAPINWWGTLTLLSPILLLVLLWFFFIRQMQGGSNRAFSFGKSRAKLVGGDKPRVTFEDVAGAEEAKVELNEIVEFLSDPKKFKRMGARIPRGCLLMGPPGTGKTLLAKAVAGEARVPFFSMSGSDFVEMFVGVGASRVRDLFEQGKKSAPCIIFVDELDAVGRHRGAGLGGGHDEREQTLNQLLVEMDGFDTSEGVILLAATNRPDVLDPALLRPGRFDRQIVVDMPDVKAREGILRVHMRNVPVADDVDVKVLAQGTPGLTGADLANLVNESALLAARMNHDQVYMIDFDEARDKILIGPERRSVIPSEEKRLMTAYHEAGHAIVGAYYEDFDSIYKVTIVARGRAGGVTHYLPKDEADQLGDQEYFLRRIIAALGGRVAEEIVFNRITAGASADIKAITGYSRHMVTQWGMSEKLGPIAYGENEEMVFLGRSIQHHQNFSERTAQLIDDEVRRIVDECADECRRILVENRAALDALAQALLERETLLGEEVQMIIRGEELAPFNREAAEAARKRKEEVSLTRGERIDAVLEQARRDQDAEGRSPPAEAGETKATDADDEPAGRRRGLMAGAQGAGRISSPRVLRARPAELCRLLAAAGSDAAGAALMTRKAELLVIRVDGLKAPAANILKQELLSAGGDCATHREVILGGPERSSVHLIATESQLRRVLRKLPAQPFGLKGLGEALKALLARRASPPKSLALPGDRAISFEAGPRLMGILNVTPDSFSDGGRWDDPGQAVERGLKLVAEGADLIDVGGESTRPGSMAVDPEEELRRVLPVIRELARQTAAPISVDTRRACVAAEALAAGASIVNDVSALGDPDMAPLVAESGAAVVLMHMRDEPATMQDAPTYVDAVDEIYRWLEARLAAAAEAGIERERLVADPGIGFGKRLEDNTALIRRLGEFHSLGVPLLLGASRKAFLGALTDEPDPGARLEGSLAAAARGAEAGAQMLRVHDMAATRRFLAAWRPLAFDEDERP